MMSSVNLGNNLVNVGASALATSVAIRMFGDEGLGIAVGIMTFLILIFGEITPKTYCNANSTKIALRYAPVLLGFSYAFYPIVKFFETVTKGVVRLTGSSYAPPPITEEEIRGVIDQGLEEKALEKDEMEMVHGALKFDDTVIRTVMTPRTRMFTLQSKMLLLRPCRRSTRAATPASRYTVRRMMISWGLYTQETSSKSLKRTARSSA